MASSEEPKETKAVSCRVYDQRYHLQRRNGEGHLIKVETYNKPISQEEVLEGLGPGYYILKSVKPRFQTVWKGQLGDKDNSEPLDRIKKTTRNLKYGLVALGTSEAVGFGLTHLRFLKAEERIDGIEAVLQYSQPVKPESLQCGSCGKPLVLMFQKHCGVCGAEVDWTTLVALTQSTQARSECIRCKKLTPVLQAYCIHCGSRQPTPISPTSMTEWKQVANSGG